MAAILAWDAGPESDGQKQTTREVIRESGVPVKVTGGGEAEGVRAQAQPSCRADLPPCRHFPMGISWGGGGVSPGGGGREGVISSVS